MNHARPFRILIVEDNRGDSDLIKEVLEDSAIPHELEVAIDGMAALERLRRGTRPDIVLLDLNLPKTDGRQVLRVIKSDDALKDIPIIVLTSSEAEKDLVEAYKLHANAYLTKPVDLEEFMAVVRGIEAFWMGLVKLPALA